MSLSPGMRLGACEIVTLLGSGGMGEVYQARDLRLHRSVAIKILPEHLASDPERRARFEHEAQSIAALNHPNIVTIHSVEQADGLLFLTMEFVEGRPLSDLIPRGGLSLERLLALAIPLADAVSAAHLKGITHRDLKPANVMVADDGRVKVLDFGLAKLVEQPGFDADMTRLGSQPITDEGRIVGTVSYMSPEQAQGKRIDARSDIFSLGVMLHEMATGDRPFEGTTAVSTITHLVRDAAPSITEINPALPRDFAQIVRRCLAKDPEHRTQTAKDLRNQLDDLQHDLHSGNHAGLTAPVVRRRTRSRIAWVAAPLAAMAVVAGVAWAVGGGLGGARDLPFVSEVARLTHDAAVSEWPTWSPDGKMVAFASNRGGNFNINVKRLEGGDSVDVTLDASQNFQPAFSPDGNWLAFVSTRNSRTGLIKVGSPFGGNDSYTRGGDVWIAPTFGGGARRLAPDGNAPVWHPDGRRIAYITGPELHRSILEVTIETGAQHPILQSESSVWEITRIRYSPSGSWITFETADGHVFAVPATGGEPHRLLAGFSHVWAPDGARLYFCASNAGGGTQLSSAAIDQGTGRLKDEPRMLSAMIGTLRDLAISPDGEHIAVTEVEGSFNLTRLPLTEAGDAPAGPEEPLTTGHVFDRNPSVAPDSRRIAYVSDRLGQRQVWILDVDNRHAHPIQPPGSYVNTLGARWLPPDGRKLLFRRVAADGQNSLWIVATDGSDVQDLGVRAISSYSDPAAISPDGGRALFPTLVDGHYQLVSVDLRTRKTKQITFSPDDKVSGVWSPDERWIAYSSNTNGSAQIWRIPAEGGRPEALTHSYDRDRHLFYSADGRWLYFQPNHLNIYRMPAAGGSAQPVTRFPEAGLFLEEPTISPDGRYLVYCRLNGPSSLWVLHLGNVPTRTH